MRTVALATLENAPSVALVAQERRLAADPAALRELCVPIGPRLGVLLVQTPEVWERLQAAVPGLTHPPDFARGGTVLGVVSWSGTSLDGEWPVALDEVRVHDGVALLRASFHPGSYLPDGSGRLELAQVYGVSVLLAVEVNGTLFCLQ